MTNKTRIRRAGDTETEIMIFTQDPYTGLFISDDDGKKYTQTELNALKSIDNKEIKKYIITCAAGDPD